MRRYRDIAGDGGSNIVGQLAVQEARLRERLAAIRRTVAVVSGKGGVGKSSITANLAAALAARRAERRSAVPGVTEIEWHACGGQERSGA